MFTISIISRSYTLPPRTSPFGSKDTQRTSRGSSAYGFSGSWSAKYKEVVFELIGITEYKDNTYYAMIPSNEAEKAQESEDGFCEYVILRVVANEDGSSDLVSVDDDEEFDDVADLFDDMFSEEIDYDQK